ncbi:MAG TPA: hypothetical protein VMF11_10460 [Candidatus Baltobacteraceae bacterium]|nr:hypothetical protein [Candidatus Baltobacteraceae bacterium]
MLRRTVVVPWAIFIFVVVMTVIGIKIYGGGELSRLNGVARIVQQPSALYADLTILYDKPPIYEEAYRTKDVEGISTFQYVIRTYAGKQISITAPREVTTDVSYFFGRLVQDGVWDLVDRPPRGNTSVHYTVYVKQLADFKQGDRTVTFTDPHYWATTAGRQFTIDLRKTNPNDLLKLRSTQLADPHYQQIVDDFRNFGPIAFRAKIAAIRASLMRGTNAK